MSEERGKRARVLVVEDEPEVRRMVQAILEDVGMEVTGVSREGEAVQRLREGRYEVVVTDLYTTRGQEGLESIAALVWEAGETPVVVMTGWPVEEEKAREVGVASVVRKPFEIKELVRVVEEALPFRAREKDE